MIINTDINILGGLPDWKLIYVFLNEDLKTIRAAGGTRSVTTIKTDRSVMRFEKAITNTLLKFINENIESLFRSIIMAEEISADSLLFIFWNASSNNELLHYMNEKVFFPALYSGRVSVKRDEASACIRELKQTESDLKKWSEVTVNTTASKYLTLLKKFGLMEGSLNKTINHLNVNTLLRIVDATSKYHFLICDRLGNVATIEFLDGQMVSHIQNFLPIPVLGNSTYKSSIECYKTDGNTDSNRSLYNFSTAAHKIQENKKSSNDSIVNDAFEILKSVSQGVGTKWSIVYDITNMNIYFKIFETPTIVGEQKIFMIFMK